MAASSAAAFLASLVEFVEALTVVLAVGSVRGWRSAIVGSALACGVLLTLVAILGSTLTHIPLRTVQLVVGILIVMFGLRWMRKAVLRAAGVIPLHDEAAAYAKNVQMLRTTAGSAAAWDRVAMATSFNITMLEGTEVIFIVIAVGAGGTWMLLAASLAAVAALLVVIALGIVLHRPLATIPENTLKFVVAVLLSAFGTFWIGEGMGMSWPGGDLAIVGMALAYLCVSLGAVAVCRQSPASRAPAKDRSI
jgi:uncharacterized membrane protein